MFNPVSYAIKAIRTPMIAGFDWTVILPAWGVIGLVAVLTLRATLIQFRKVGSQSLSSRAKELREIESRDYSVQSF